MRLFTTIGPQFAVLDGHEVREVSDVMEWSKIFDNSDRVVAQIRLNDFWVSTVFLGLNHNHYFEGPPLWFETIVFRDVPGSELPNTVMQKRYTTWTEAEAGHAELVEAVRYGNL